MPPSLDTRRGIGNQVHAKATFVTSLAECSRRYGSNKKAKMLTGMVERIDSVSVAGQLSNFIVTV